MAAERILVVDDDLPVAESIAEILRFGGYLVDLATTLRAAEESLTRDIYDAAVVDLRMESTSGLDVLEKLRRIDPAIAAIMLTAYGTTESATRAFHLGALDFLEKPVRREHLLTSVGRALELSRANREIRNLRRRVGTTDAFAEALGTTDDWMRVTSIARRAAGSDLPIVIQGETGTGKGVLAAAIHAASPRAEGPFTSAVIAASVDQLQKADLFGYVKGAFTGAVTSHRGFFQQADRGTLFLDEIGDITPEMQVALLRAVEQGVIRPAGSEHEVQVDVRIISATNRNLNSDVTHGRFREDLLFRLGGIFINLPPLRQRKPDIVPLAEHFLKQLAGPGREPLRLSDEARAMLVDYNWPGNIRELKNVVERATVLSDGQWIQPSDCLLYPPTRRHSDDDGFADGELLEMELEQATAEFSRRYLHALLKQCAGDKSMAAARAGIHVTSLRRKMRQLGMDTPANDST